MTQSTAPTPRIISREEGKRVMGLVMPTTFKLTGDDSERRFSVVEHLVQPKSLGAPPHTHRHEDEYSYVLEGELGVEVGEERFTIRAGEMIVKPCGIRHAFWNATDKPARLLEIISPAGFEHYFADIDSCFKPDGPPDIERLMATAERYGLVFEMDRVPELLATFGLGFADN